MSGSQRPVFLVFVLMIIYTASRLLGERLGQSSEMLSSSSPPVVMIANPNPPILTPLPRVPEEVAYEDDEDGPPSPAPTTTTERHQGKSSHRAATVGHALGMMQHSYTLPALATPLSNKASAAPKTRSEPPRRSPTVPANQYVGTDASHLPGARTPPSSPPENSRLSARPLNPRSPGGAAAWDEAAYGPVEGSAGATPTFPDPSLAGAGSGAGPAGRPVWPYLRCFGQAAAYAGAWAARRSTFLRTPFPNHTAMEYHDFNLFTG